MAFTAYIKTINQVSDAAFEPAFIALFHSPHYLALESHLLHL